MKKLSAIFVLILSLIFISCTEDSPLSDIEIDDPSIIKPDITISKNISTSSVYYDISAWLYDKNNNSIELKSGEVKLNELDMKVKRGINHEPYYKIEPFDDLPFQINTTYKCKIKLSDGKVYNSEVKSRSRDLYRLNVPTDHNRNQDINISWNDADNDKKLKLTMVLYGKNDSANTVNVSEFNISNPASGIYTVTKSYFSNSSDINRVQFTLESIITGEINNSFMSGSKITSSISISRYVNLY